MGEVLDAIRNTLPRLCYDRAPDCVDGLPAFEVLFVNGGSFLHEELASILQDTLQNRILPLLRRSRLSHAKARGNRSSNNLVLCQALIRVYNDGHRRLCPVHYDNDALITAMFE